MASVVSVTNSGRPFTSIMVPTPTSSKGGRAWVIGSFSKAVKVPSSSCSQISSPASVTRNHSSQKPPG
jgi:hypothetical protein